MRQKDTERQRQRQKRDKRRDSERETQTQTDRQSIAVHTTRVPTECVRCREECPDSELHNVLAFSGGSHVTVMN